MTAATLTITDFLLARIAEDEAAAQEAIDSDRPGTHWRWDRDDDGALPIFTLRTEEEFATTSGVGDLPAFPIGYEPQVEKTRALAHIARHDPARVLAECDAKRRIVEDYLALDADYRVTRSRETEVRRFQALVSVGQLATAYADHPDYRDEWRP